MATLLNDTFTDTNGTAVTTHVMNVGGGWTATPGSSAPFLIESNRAQLPQGAEGLVYANAGATDYTLTADLVIGSAGTFDGFNAGFLIRFVDDNNFWLCQFNGDLADGWAADIYEVVAGGFTLRSSSSVTLSANATHSIQVDVSGTSIALKLDGTVVASYGSMGTFGTSTKVGLRCRDNNSTTKYSLDNFLVVSAGGGGTIFPESLAGSATPAGALRLAVSKALAGSSTPAGALAKQAAKPLAGSLAGSGGLTRRANKAAAGSTAPAGSLANRAGKPLAGSSTPAGSLGTLAVKLASMAGSVTPSGAETHQAQKGAAGGVQPTGALTKQAAKPLAGSATPAGALAKQAGKPFAGSTTPAGTLSALKAVAFSVAGAVAGAGGLVRRAMKALAGLVTGTGSLTTSGGSPPVVVATPGGIVRRPGPVSRLARRPGNLSRTVRRPEGNMASGTIEYESREQAAAEVVKYCIDFTRFPEIAAGDTVAGVAVSADAGITAAADGSAPAADDPEGPAAGKFWYVTVRGGAAGTDYLVRVNATLSGGAVRAVWLKVQVR